MKNNELNVDGIVKNWEKLFKENVIDFAEQKGSSDEEVFAAAYHKLVHSPALETIMQVESAYAKTVMTMLKNRDEDIQKLTKRYLICLIFLCSINTPQFFFVCAFFVLN